MPVPDEPLREDHTELRPRVLTEDVASHDAVKRCRAALGRTRARTSPISRVIRQLVCSRSNLKKLG
jgi:hypothetical protein